MSTARLGPCSPRKNESRPAATLSMLPVPPYKLAASSVEARGARRTRWGPTPTNTPVRALPQRRRRLARVLERLPAHLQQQALLRVEAQRLPGRDAEEARVERLHLAQEATLGHVRPARDLRVRVVPVRGAPPARRHLGGGHHALGQQLPVGLQILGPAGEPAGGAHDRDRLVRRPRPRAGHVGAVLQVQHVGEQVRNQPLHRRVVERQRRRQRHAQLTLKLVADLHRHQRVEPLLGEASPQVERARISEAQHPSDRPAHEREESRAGLRCGLATPAPRYRRRSGRRGAVVLRNQRRQQVTPPSRGVHRREARPVHPGHRALHRAGPHQALQRRQGRRRGHGQDPDVVQTCLAPPHQPMPPSAHRPHAMLNAGNDCARRWCASPSRKALAAA